MSARRILITGATGGLGQALVREALARGHDVRATGRSRCAEAALMSRGADFVMSDLNDPAADLRSLMEGCDSVIHAAALSASWGPAEMFDTSNVIMTNRLMDAAAQNGVTRLIFVSSPSIFARFADQIAIGEHELPALRPLNHYARTKLVAERNVLARRSDGLACCVIRPRALVGSGDRVILPRLIALARRKRMPLPRGGTALIELTDLRDAAWAICEAEARASDLAGRAINISGGQPVSVRDVALQLTAALGETPRLLALPIGVAKLLAGMLETFARLSASAKEPMLTRYTLATLGWSQTFDPDPARCLLDYVPRHDALETLLGEARKLAQAESAA